MSFSSPQTYGVSAGSPFLCTRIKLLAGSLVAISLAGPLWAILFAEGSLWWLLQPVLTLLPVVVMLRAGGACAAHPADGLRHDEPGQCGRLSFARDQYPAPGRGG